MARRAVRESLVLLKNEKHALPLAKSLKRIHVAGRGADDMPMQAGGWTVHWQGLRVAGKPDVQIPGTTILAAIKAAVPTATTRDVLEGRLGSGGRRRRGRGGGRGALRRVRWATAATSRWRRRTRTRSPRRSKAGKPLVVVLLSGRPMIVTRRARPQADAFVAAWLPGTEGAGVADVLFGDHKPTGKLPMSWPRTNAQIPINVGDATYDPLFKYGYGLTY